jgi:AcrR family transcriptional regulator
VTVRLPARERRETVVAAALDVFGARGYSDASMDEVAGRAGITKPILYRHFDNKEALYVALLEEQARVMEDRGRARFAPGGRRRYPDDDAAEIIDALFEHLELYPFTVRVLQREPEPREAIAQARARIHVGILREARAILLSLRPELRTSDPARQAVVDSYCEMVAGVQAQTARWWQEHPGIARDEVVASVMRFLRFGVAGIPA